MTKARWIVGALLLALVGVFISIPYFASPGHDESAALDNSRVVPTPVAVEPKARKKNPKAKWVLAISVDGLNPEAIRTLGPSKAPNFYRLMAEGAYTLNARTEQEITQTLPNHTGMVTGRPVYTSRHGHGVTFNVDNGSTVRRTAGYPVKSIFTVVHNKLGKTGLFASKSKFDFLARSWPNSIDRYTMINDNDQLTTSVMRDMKNRRKFTLLHLSAPDEAGHAYGWMSDEYLTNVRESDRRLGRIMDKIDSKKRLRRHLTLLVTADHGGTGVSHQDPTLYADYRIPFFAWGRGIKHADLYDLNSRWYADPGTSRPGYTGKQPIRNADIANLSAKLLGIKPVKFSRIGVGQRINLYPR